MKPKELILPVVGVISAYLLFKYFTRENPQLNPITGQQMTFGGFAGQEIGSNIGEAVAGIGTGIIGGAWNIGTYAGSGIAENIINPVLQGANAGMTNFIYDVGNITAELPNVDFSVWLNPLSNPLNIANPILGAATNISSGIISAIPVPTLPTIDIPYISIPSFELPRLW